MTALEITYRLPDELHDKHRVLCGDARSSDDFATLIGERTADMVFTDPP